MLYEEVGDQLQTLGILSHEEIQRQQQLLKTLPTDGLPAMWRTVGVTGAVSIRGVLLEISQPSACSAARPIRITRTAFSLRPNRAAGSASGE